MLLDIETGKIQRRIMVLTLEWAHKKCIQLIMTFVMVEFSEDTVERMSLRGLAALHY